MEDIFQGGEVESERNKRINKVIGESVKFYIGN